MSQLEPKSTEVTISIADDGTVTTSTNPEVFRNEQNRKRAEDFEAARKIALARLEKVPGYLDQSADLKKPFPAK